MCCSIWLVTKLIGSAVLFLSRRPSGFQWKRRFLRLNSYGDNKVACDIVLIRVLRVALCVRLLFFQAYRHLPVFIRPSCDWRPGWRWGWWLIRSFTVILSRGILRGSRGCLMFLFPRDQRVFKPSDFAGKIAFHWFMIEHPLPPCFYYNDWFITQIRLQKQWHQTIRRD